MITSLGTCGTDTARPGRVARIERVMDKLIQTDSQTVASACEERIKKLETDKAVLAEREGFA